MEYVRGQNQNHTFSLLWLSHLHSDDFCRFLHATACLLLWDYCMTTYCMITEIDLFDEFTWFCKFCLSHVHFYEQCHHWMLLFFVLEQPSLHIEYEVRRPSVVWWYAGTFFSLMFLSWDVHNPCHFVMLKIADTDNQSVLWIIFIK